MLFALLEDETSGSSSYMTYIFLAIIIVAFVVFLVFSNRKQKKKEEETKSMLDAIQPGNKVKTIGGICGIVKEVNAEDNTFVLETGTEESGKCCIKFDKQAVYQTDAKAPAKETPKKNSKADKEDSTEEIKEEPRAEETKEKPQAEEKPAEEENAEENK